MQSPSSAPCGRRPGARARSGPGESAGAHRGGVAAAAAIEGSRVPLERVDEVVFVNARQAGNGPNLARQVQGYGRAPTVDEERAVRATPEPTEASIRIGGQIANASVGAAEP